MEVSVALVGLGEASVDCEDARGSWHFELEVGVVRDRHELCERWSPQYDMVLRLLVEYLKLEGLFCEVASAAEDNFELDLSKGGGCFPWYYSMQHCT